jgi:THO complex subunit 2
VYFNNVFCLLGCFNLDPNRVLDVLLECFECRPYLYDSYVPLLRNFLNNSTTLSQILAFKFGFYHNDISLITPDSLYEITAILLQENLIQFEDIYPYLSPSDSSIFEYHQNELNEAKSFAKKTMLMSTSDPKLEEDKMTDLERHTLIANNQKLGLCLALIKVGDWKTAKDLINRLPDYYAVSNPKITKQLCSLIHYAIDHFYHT